MIKLFLTKKEKFTSKIYNLIYTKEYILENISMFKYIDSILICSYGIFVFSYLFEHENSKENIVNLKENIKNEAKIISNIFNNKYVIESYILTKKKELNDINIYSLKDLDGLLNNKEKILTNEEVEIVRKGISKFVNNK